MDYSKLVRQALQEVLENSGEPHRFFSAGYEQTVNGKKLNFMQFCKHIACLRKTLEKTEVKILSLATEGNNVHSHHLIKAIKAAGDISEFEVFARFRCEAGKIVACYELTRQLSGDIKDEGLASRL